MFESLENSIDSNLVDMIKYLQKWNADNLDD